jgi:hypothetical protein
MGSVQSWQRGQATNTDTVPLDLFSANRGKTELSPANGISSPKLPWMAKSAAD